MTTSIVVSGVFPGLDFCHSEYQSHQSHGGTWGFRLRRGFLGWSSYQARIRRTTVTIPSRAFLRKPPLVPIIPIYFNKLGTIHGWFMIHDDFKQLHLSSKLAKTIRWLISFSHLKPRAFCDWHQSLAETLIPVAHRHYIILITRIIS